MFSSWKARRNGMEFATRDRAVKDLQFRAVHQFSVLSQKLNDLVRFPRGTTFKEGKQNSSWHCHTPCAARRPHPMVGIVPAYSLDLLRDLLFALLLQARPDHPPA